MPKRVIRPGSHYEKYTQFAEFRAAEGFEDSALYRANAELEIQNRNANALESIAEILGDILKLKHKNGR